MSLFGPEDVVFRYTRKDAIRDGVLIDLSQGELGILMKPMGFQHPTAMTDTAFKLYVQVSHEMHQAGQTESDRLRPILKSLGMAVMARNQKGSRDEILIFSFQATTEESQPTQGRLKAIGGPDDDGNPCVTIMLPNED